MLLARAARQARVRGELLAVEVWSRDTTCDTKCRAILLQGGGGGCCGGVVTGERPERGVVRALHPSGRRFEPCRAHPVQLGCRAVPGSRHARRTTPAVTPTGSCPSSVRATGLQRASRHAEAGRVRKPRGPPRRAISSTCSTVSAGVEFSCSACRSRHRTSAEGETSSAAALRRSAASRSWLILNERVTSSAAAFYRGGVVHDGMPPVIPARRLTWSSAWRVLGMQRRHGPPQSPLRSR
jgi:hypothetical protein